MRAILRLFIAVVMVAAVLLFNTSGFVAGNQAAWANELPETNFYKADNSKIDLNNSNINAFRQISGMYPTLARIIVENAPYSSLDEVLSIPELTEAQKQRIKENADKFTLKKPDSSLNRERINNSTYRL